MAVRADSTRLHLRQVTREDTDAVCALLAACVPGTPKADPAVYRWLYWDNPFGAPHNLVWEHEGRLVAHGGLYEVPAVVEGQPIRLGRTSDAVTTRSYQGHGLFGSLARRQLEEAAAAGVEATMTLPNPAALPGYSAAGMVEIARAERWVRPHGPHFSDLAHVPRPVAGALARLAFGPPPEADGTEVPGPPEGLEDLLARRTGAAVAAGPDWWRWRYVDHPRHRYQFFEQRRRGQLTAACATRQETFIGAPFLHVMAWLADDAEAAAGVLGAAIAASPGCAGVTALAARGASEAEWARSSGFHRLPALLDDASGPVGIVPHRTATPAVGGVTWHLSWSIHDHL